MCLTESPDEGFARTYRGGCWDITARVATSASRESLPDDTKLGLIGLGFRCVRDASR